MDCRWIGRCVTRQIGSFVHLWLYEALYLNCINDLTMYHLTHRIIWAPTNVLHLPRHLQQINMKSHIIHGVMFPVFVKTWLALNNGQVLNCVGDGVLSSEHFNDGKQEWTTWKDRQIEKDSQHRWPEGGNERDAGVWMATQILSYFSITENKSQNNGVGERDGEKSTSLIPSDVMKPPNKFQHFTEKSYQVWYLLLFHCGQLYRRSCWRVTFLLQGRAAT